MDKQFMRILMLSILLPAGAALGQAFQHEHVTFTALDQGVMSELVGASRADLARNAAVEDRQTMTTIVATRDQRVQHRVLRDGAETSVAR